MDTLHPTRISIFVLPLIELPVCKNPSNGGGLESLSFASSITLVIQNVANVREGSVLHIMFSESNLHNGTLFQVQHENPIDSIIPVWLIAARIAATLSLERSSFASTQGDVFSVPALQRTSKGNDRCWRNRLPLKNAPRLTARLHCVSPMCRNSRSTVSCHEQHGHS